MGILDITFNIDSNIKTPLWKQIRDELLGCLSQGSLRPGQLVPNEKTLVDLFSVSIGTVRKAIDSLEKDGVLVRKQGLGTFVCEHDDSSFLFKYFHICTKDSNEREIPEVECVSFQSRVANIAESKILKIPEGNNKVFDIYNSLAFNGKIHSIDKITIPIARFPLMTKEVFVNRHSTIYNLYQNKFNVFISKCSERVTAGKAKKNIADMLGIDEGESILKIRRTGFSFHNEVVELRTSYANTKGVEYIREEYSTVGHQS